MALFVVGGVASFVRAAIEWGVVASAEVTAAVLVATLGLAALLNRRPTSRVSRALARDTRFSRSVERALPPLFEVSMAVVGPCLVVFGGVLIVAGQWAGAVTLVVGAWLAWEGWTGLLRGR
jgi:hypothetical protein